MLVHGLYEISKAVTERASDVAYNEKASRAWKGLMKLAKEVDKYNKEGDRENSVAIAKGHWIDMSLVSQELNGLFVAMTPMENPRVLGSFGYAKQVNSGPGENMRHVIQLYTDHHYSFKIRDGKFAEALKHFQTTFFHEFVHYLDNEVSKGAAVVASGVNYHTPKGEINFKTYYNDPTEMNAHMHQVMQFMYHTMRSNKAYMMHLLGIGAGAFTRLIVKHLPDAVPGFWENLTPNNRKRVVKRIASYYNDVIVPDAKATMARDAKRRGSLQENEQPQQPQTKIVDANGRLLVVYHGSARRISKFRSDRGYGTIGAYFTPNKDEAIDLAQNDYVEEGDQPRVYSCHLYITNPAMLTGVDSQEITVEQGAKLKKQGYDGAIGVGQDGKPFEYVTFNARQIRILKIEKVPVAGTESQPVQQ